MKSLFNYWHNMSHLIFTSCLKEIMADIKESLRKQIFFIFRQRSSGFLHCSKLSSASPNSGIPDRFALRPKPDKKPQNDSLFKVQTRKMIPYLTKWWKTNLRSYLRSKNLKTIPYSTAHTYSVCGPYVGVTFRGFVLYRKNGVVEWRILFYKMLCTIYSKPFKVLKM